MTLKEKVKNLPSSPGVYLMKDVHDQIIYVGKAKNLKRRVQSYFQNSKNHSPKTVKLVNNIKGFDYILTDTEFEAFMLECKLIQELKPFFNKKMKSPKSYAYIVVKTDVKMQKVEVANCPIGGKNTLYFGPYTNKNTVTKAVQGMKDFLKINCLNPANKNSSCLNYTLGLCIGMCLGGSAVKKYDDRIQRMIGLFDGTDMSILEEMNKKMIYSSEQFDFEAAAKYRDCINAINSLVKQEKVIGFTEENKNIVILEYLNDDSFKLFFIKGKHIFHSEKHRLTEPDIEQFGEMIRKNILTYFKTHSLDSTTEVNRDEIDEAQIIYSYLKSSNCRYIIIPDKWLDDMDIENINCELIQLLEN